MKVKSSIQLDIPGAKGLTISAKTLLVSLINISGYFSIMIYEKKIEKQINSPFLIHRYIILIHGKKKKKLIDAR
jgi:hypothetical protein